MSMSSPAPSRLSSAASPAGSPMNSRPQRCDAAPKAERARPPKPQTDAPATAPRAKDQTQPATQPSAHPQAPLPLPRVPKAEGAPLPQPKPPAAQPQAAQERSCE